LSVEEAILEGKKAFAGLEEGRRLEQEWLFECLMVIWAEKRLPVLRSEFDFLLVEKEILWVLGEDSSKVILQMVRPDLLARRLSDGELFYLEWKTTSSGGEDWARKWEKNTQVFCNALAIQESLKERVSGVMIEGLVKGPIKREWRKSSRYKGEYLQQSKLCYGWRGLDGELSSKWFYGADHVKLWEEGITPRGWLKRLGEVEHQELGEFLCPVPAISPSADEQEDWRIGAEAMMFRIDEGLEKLVEEKSPEGKRRVVSRYFPANFEACYQFGPEHRCSHFELCFNPGARKAPLESGFVPRTPHHEAEK
jgi:hypothetical protein